MNHAAELRRAFDTLAIDFCDHVIFFQTSFGRGAVRNDSPKQRAAFGGKLQFLSFLGGDFLHFDAKPT